MSDPMTGAGAPEAPICHHGDVYSCRACMVHWDEAHAAGIAAERARVVSWLRHEAKIRAGDDGRTVIGTIWLLADEIEQEIHLLAPSTAAEGGE